MVSVHMQDDVVIVAVERNILIDDVDNFEHQVNEAYADGYTRFVFDFGTAEYICSSALGVMANLLKNVMTQKEGAIYFCNLTEKLKNIFEATQFTTIVNVEEDVAHALAKIAS